MMVCFKGDLQHSKSFNLYRELIEKSCGNFNSLGNHCYLWIQDLMSFFFRKEIQFSKKFGHFFFFQTFIPKYEQKASRHPLLYTLSGVLGGQQNYLIKNNFFVLST